MSELIEWLSACLDDDERAAKLMAEFYPGTWEIADRGWMARVVADGPSFWEVTRLEQWPTMPTGADAATLGQIIDHVERWQPDRVLAEVAAKRRILALYTGPADFPDWDGGYTSAMGDVLRALALPYAARDGYRDEWRPVDEEASTG
ncbi:DUF6221 family protein [Pseudonocardia sp.]|uniref:DUF6221 family protein n=1 Tax=Pseudonocardia sp. TaxID=60912 RepID=UPI003D0F421A